MDDTFYERAQKAHDEHGGHVVVAGENYAQGSSREHAAIAPRFLGQKAVIAKSYARIGWQNLVNFGIVPLEFIDEENYDEIEQGDVLRIENLRNQLESSETVEIENVTKNRNFATRHSLSGRQLKALLDGGIINTYRKEKMTN